MIKSIGDKTIKNKEKSTGSGRKFKGCHISGQRRSRRNYGCLSFGQQLILNFGATNSHNLHEGINGSPSMINKTNFSSSIAYPASKTSSEEQFQVIQSNSQSFNCALEISSNQVSKL